MIIRPIKYDRVSSADPAEEKQSEPSTQSVRWSSGVRAIIVVVVTTALGIVFFTSLGFYRSHSTRTTSGGSNYDSTSPCGNSSVEALAQGCSFDQLMWSWYPSHCPHYANDQFLQAEPERPWQFFVDPYTKDVADEAQWNKALSNELDLYGEKREHLAHCVFMFLSYAQIVTTKGSYVQKFMEYEHAEHCAELLLETLKKDDTRYDVGTSAGPVSFQQDCKT